MKSSTSPLLQHLRHLAKCRQRDPKLPETPEALGLLAHYGQGPLKHSHWLQLVARDLKLDYNEVSRESRLFERFCDFNVKQKLWPAPVNFMYEPLVFERQLAALVDAGKNAISVSEAATHHHVTFERFDFSNMVLRYVLERTGPVMFCLDGLYAPDSVMWGVWGSYCSSYEGADLRRCKFISLYVDPTILPGANIFEAKFAKANLEGADLRLAYLRGSDFFMANLTNADLRNTTITSCRFTGARGPVVTGDVDTDSWMMPC